MVKLTCECCGKVFEYERKRMYCSQKCSSRNRYLRNREKYIEYQKKYSKDNYEEIKEDRKRRFKEWYKKNKERQKENVKRDYEKNYDKWMVRRYTQHFRDRFLEILPKKCDVCGKEPVKIIHHKKFDGLPRLGKLRPTEKERMAGLKKYSKFLVPLCSKTCLGAYRRKHG